jgi:Tfp pilus assembly protein FimT
MVVVLILGVLFAISLPAFQNYNRGLALRRARETVTNELRRARQRAASEHHNVNVSFGGAGTGEFRLHDDTNNDGVVNGGELVRVVHLPASTMWDGRQLSAGDTLVFRPTGMLSNPNAGGALFLGGCGGARDTLYISAVGHISGT